MATYYSQGDGPFSTTTNWDTNRGGGGSDPASANEAGMAGHTFIIQPGHEIEYDMDMSGWSGTTGLYALTIEGDATTPGMLYCKYSGAGTYHLRIQGGSATANIISGTNQTVLGRILANSDGVWANSTALPNDRKFIIEFMGTTAGKLIDQYLDVKLLCTQPTNTYVEVYKTAYTCTDQTTDVNASTDVITFTSAPPSAGTAVMVRSSGTLPGGLSATAVYFTRTVSGNTCKLALQNSDTTIVDITSTGSGTLTMYDGHTSTSTKDIVIVQDLTSDIWVTTAGHNRVVLVDCNAPENYDQQRDTLAAIDTSAPFGLTITTNNVDSAQYPLARIYYMSRNVSIRSNSTSTSQPIIDSVNSSRGTGNTYQCEILAAAGTGTTFYAIGINFGSGHTISGTISGCNNGINSGSGHIVSGTVSGCLYGIYSGSGHTVSGTISGCSYGIYYGSGHTISGTISGCTYGINSASGNTISGTISGCTNGINSGLGHTISGTISGCFYGINSGSGHIVSGMVSGCSSGTYYGSGYTISGTVSGCSDGINSGSGHIVSGMVSGCTNGINYGSGYTISGTVSGCSNGIYYSGFVAHGMTLSGNGTDVTYSGITAGPMLRGRSFHHAGTANDTRSWSAGGAGTHETTEKPSGKSYSHKFTHVDSGYWTVMEWEITRPMQESLSITVHAKHDATSLADDARIHWQLIDPDDDPLINPAASLLDSFIAIDSTDWQSDTLTYDKADDRMLLLRACAKRGSGNSYIYVEPMTGGTGGGAPRFGDMTGGLK